MPDQVRMTPRGEIVWEQMKFADGVLTFSPDFEPEDLPLSFEDLVNLSSEAYFSSGLDGCKLLGEGGYYHGKVFEVGCFAVKYSLQHGQVKSGRTRHDPSNVLNQSRIAVSLNHGLSSKTLGRHKNVTSPMHYACWQEIDSPVPFQIQIMDVVPGRIFRPGELPDKLERRIQRTGARALKKVGIQQSEIYWEDLPINVIMSPDGVPSIIDLMPVNGLPSFT